MPASVWKGHLTFGLVSLPIKLFTAARSETISFNQLHKTDHSRVKQVLYCQAEDKPVVREDLVKGYEYEKGRYVIVDAEDIAKAAPPTAENMEILEFVKAGEIDPVYFETSFYIAPESAGEKAYALLFEALRRTGYVGVAKVAMHSREHIVILRPGASGLLLHTMYYADEVRKTEEFRTNTSLVADKELELAQMFVKSLEAVFEPGKYHDQYRENLKALIQSRVEGQAMVEPPPPQKLAPVVDIMQALKASMEKIAQKKPVQSALPLDAPAREKPKRARKASAK
ncbi:MAG: Ku protein [Acidobacteria bacterium]|nr:Ku protein [Acidobacteriota bacterium]